MYSVVLMVAMTGGNSAVMDRHHHRGGGCCGQSSCGCSGASYGGGGCGYGGGYGGCATCGGYGGYASGGCSTCASGVCPINGAVVMGQAPATIVVSLPADAKLTIDDEATASTSDHRVFVTPNLPTGQEFHYTLKAEVKADGKSQVVSRVVTVRAGEQTEVQLPASTSVAER